MEIREQNSAGFREVEPNADDRSERVGNQICSTGIAGQVRLQNFNRQANRESENNSRWGPMLHGSHGRAVGEKGEPEGVQPAIFNTTSAT